MLFTITRAAEDESETAVKRWALLIWIALNQDINVVWEIEVLFEYPQCPIKELAQSSSPSISKKPVTSEVLVRAS